MSYTIIRQYHISFTYFKNAFKDVIPNAVDVDRKAVEETIDWRVKKPPDRSLKFLYMGRLSETKGVRLLINAFKILFKAKTLLSLFAFAGFKKLGNYRFSTKPTFNKKGWRTALLPTLPLVIDSILFH